MDKENFNQKEAARYICVSDSKMNKMTASREIRFHKVGRLNVFRKKDLDDFLERNVRPSITDLENKAEKILLTAKPRSHI